MSRRTYTAGDQARVAVALQVNEGNIKRTARETNTPVATVRDWKRKWEAEGYPDPVQEALPAAREDAVNQFESTRLMMVERLNEALERDDVKPPQLIVGIGVFTDKINVMRGLATSRTETVAIAAPDMKELAAALSSYIDNTVGDALRRHDEIEDAEWEQAPPKALLPA